MRILEQLKKLCVDYYRDRLLALVVFGSVANKSFTPASDIDLLIILKDTKSNYNEYSLYYDNVESRLKHGKLHIEINPIFKTGKNLSVQTPYLWNTEFIILYDRDDFFRTFLRKLDEYKQSSIIVRNQKMEYIVVNDGK